VAQALACGVSQDPEGAPVCATKKVIGGSQSAFCRNLLEATAADKARRKAEVVFGITGVEGPFLKL
jgi:hypothetical protein